MKKIYLGMIIVFALTLIGCSKTAIQQKHIQTDNPSDTPTTSPITTPTTAPKAVENVVTPNAVKYYSDENHKIIKFGKLSAELGIYHIVSETSNGSDYTIEYKEDESISSSDSPVENMIIREMKNQDLMDQESIKSYLIEMMPGYENIRIYNNITEDSGITYMSVISGGGKTYCIVNYGDTSYFIDSNINTIEWCVFTTAFNTANYEEIKQNIECANSFSATIHEIIDYETKIIKYDIIQNKNGKRYSAEINFGGDDRDVFTLKNDHDKNLLNITLGGGEPNSEITFIDVNLDGYADIQAVDAAGAMNSLYNLYVWDESANNFVKVNCDTEISYFEVNEGCLVTWERGGPDSGIQKVLSWKDNNTLVKTSEEEYHTDDWSDSDTETAEEDISGIENTNGTEENLDFLAENGLRVFENQSFSTEFENFGKVRFVTGGVEGDNPFELRVYLTDDNGNVIYTFPDFYGNNWSMLTEVSAVAFKDVNRDGLKDIIIIAYYMTGVGEKGAEEFPVAGIYFQSDKEFIDISEIDEQINAEGKNASIDEVIKYTKSIDFSRK
jgi:hypothetical protein